MDIPDFVWKIGAKKGAKALIKYLVTLEPLALAGNKIGVESLDWSQLEVFASVLILTGIEVGRNFAKHKLKWKWL